MYYIATLEFKQRPYTKESKTIMIEANSLNEAKFKLYKHFDVHLIEWDLNDQVYNILVQGDNDNEFTNEPDITEIIK